MGGDRTGRSINGLGSEEDIFRVLVENSHELTIVTDKEGIVRYVSPHCRSSIGFEGERFMGKTFPDIIHPEDVEKCRNAWSQVVQGGGVLAEFEYRIIDPEGRVRWLSHSAKTMVVGEQRIGVQNTIRDITKRKKVELALLASKHFNETMLNASPDVIYVYDIIERKNVYSNNGIVRILGYTVDEIKALGERLVSTLMHPDDFKFYLENTVPRYQSLADGEFITHEYRMRHKLGKWCWLVAKETLFRKNENGIVTQIFGLISDITKQREDDAHIRLAQAALRDSENKYRRLFQNMGSAFALHEVITDADGTPIDYLFIEVNDEFEKMTGRQRKDILGRRVTDIRVGVEGDPEEWVRTLGTVAFGGKNLNFVHYSEPQCRWYAVVAYCPVAGQFAAIFTDITEQKALEARLVESEKMKAIGQLAGGIAHDFNNQLAGIVGYADLLFETSAPGTASAEYAEKILVATDRAASLTAQLLAFARKGKYFSVSVDLRTLVEETVDILKHTIDRRIKISPSLSDTPLVVQGDPSQLQNAILNLALNARDAMSEGGELRMETTLVRYDDKDCEQHPFGIEPGEYVQVAVSDTGCGMDESIQSRMFEPFFTTKDIQKGTGMGLAAVYGTIKNHGGAIDVVSEVGKGTTVRISLPHRPEVLPVSAQKVVDELVSGSAHVLLVDDEAVVIDICRAMLRKLGYSVSVCTNGVEAVSFFEENWQNIDLVILDMVMPEMDGKRACRNIRAINPKVPVLLSSGYSLDQDAQALLEEGIGGFIQKPFRLPQLSRKVSTLTQA